jgi:hypothetical protein
VNQTDEVEIIRHGRKLAANRMGHQKESAIDHEHDNAAEASRAFKGFSANGNNPLKPVSQSRGALHFDIFKHFMKQLEVLQQPRVGTLGACPKGQAVAVRGRGTAHNSRVMPFKQHFDFAS